jgi:hypothetical protein
VKTDQTEKASTDNQPKAGDVLLYIDWQGNRLFGKPTKPSDEAKDQETK